MAPQNVAVIGAGWAGMAAAIAHRQAGRQVTVFEAARTVGGRARAVPGVLPEGAAAVAPRGGQPRGGMKTCSRPSGSGRWQRPVSLLSEARMEQADLRAGILGAS